MPEVSREMPKYKSHKVVAAFKIEELVDDASGGATMYPAEEGFAPVELSAEYMKRHDPHEGGYYIVYADGYESFSPAKAFEAGYTRIDGGDHGIQEGEGKERAGSDEHPRDGHAPLESGGSVSGASGRAEGGEGREGGS